MSRVEQFTAVIEREGDGYVALCPELDIASQGDSIEEARRNLQEALELFFETASPLESLARLDPSPNADRPGRHDRERIAELRAMPSKGGADDLGLSPR